ncbi:type I-Fv CRISPR-associated protein Cas5fv [Moraxella canis]|uniref:type I-Fv CRISPR-associated protein Cas5fv n=1 Tax=Moraxella canis TaxID=90239 RepID=UPI0006694F1A|nr:type I-Fv CRISPR-associated protein Cas5fv [Moraxella canis]
MKIIIKYESSWRNSFLDGSNNEPLPKKGRNFIASTKKLEKSENYLSRPVGKDTVMGVLNRLIGDQRKLYQARQSDDYYFRELEDLIEYIDKPKYISHEVIYLRNIKSVDDQKGYMGVIIANHPIFQSDYSFEFWNILSLDIEQLCEFILDDKKIGEFDIDKPISLEPISILVKLSQIKGENVSFEDKVKNASEYLLKYFGQKDDKDKGYEIKVNKKNQIPQLGLYCCALYLQMQRLEDRLNIIMPKSARGGISGISKNGFTPKNIMETYVTNGKKQSYGSPYIYFDKEDKLNKWLTKANGILEIQLNLTPEQAKDLKQKIEYAGVSAFYLGKKGLAYVDKIVP